MTVTKEPFDFDKRLAAKLKTERFARVFEIEGHTVLVRYNTDEDSELAKLSIAVWLTGIGCVEISGLVEWDYAENALANEEECRTRAELGLKSAMGLHDLCFNGKEPEDEDA
jgi:hypothetical protein